MLTITMMGNKPTELRGEEKIRRKEKGEDVIEMERGRCTVLNGP